MNPTSGDVRAYVQLLDRNSDGYIDFLEFARAWWEWQVSQGRSDKEAELDMVFSLLDTNNNGMISAAELRALLTTVGERMTNEEVDALLAEADQDQSGTISLEEFKKLPCWWDGDVAPSTPA